MPTTITIANLHPTSDLDPYALEFLLDPYPFHEQLRNAGSVVWLKPSIILKVDPPVHTRSRARRKYSLTVWLPGEALTGCRIWRSCIRSKSLVMPLSRSLFPPSS